MASSSTSKLLLLAVACSLLAAATATHTCNSGWKNWLLVEEGRQSYNETAADAVFNKAIPLIAKREGCKVKSSEKLEGCYDPMKTPKDAQDKEPRRLYGFGAVVNLTGCKKGKKSKALQVIVHAKTNGSGGVKLAFYYTAPWKAPPKGFDVDNRI